MPIASKRSTTVCLRKALGVSTVVLMVLGILSLAGAGQVNLEYWDQLSPQLDNPRGRALADEIRRFEEANPNVKITARALAWHQIPSQLVQAAGVGKTPCVSRILIWDLPLVAKAGASAPLDEFANRWPASVKNDFVLPWGGPGTINGQKMAVPVEQRVFLLWYRKDLLEAAGVKPPKTTKEMIDVGKALNKGNIQGVVIPLASARNTGLVEWFYPMLWAGGGDMFDAKGSPTFNGEAGVRATQFLADLTRGGAMPQDVIADTYDTVTDKYKAGRIALMTLGSHRVVTVREGGKFGENLQTMPLPGYASDKPAPAHVMGWGVMMGKDCQHREEAWKLIEHFISPQTQLNHAKMTGELPSRKSPYQDAWFQGKDAAEVRQWVEYMEKSGKMPQYPEHYTKLAELLGDAVQEVILKNVSPQEALNKAADRYRALSK